MTNPECSLEDNKEAVDSIVIETGNNAEIPITVYLCEKHLKEQEETGYAFEEKYAKRFLEMAYSSIGF